MKNNVLAVGIALLGVGLLGLAACIHAPGPVATVTSTRSNYGSSTSSVEEERLYVAKSVRTWITEGWAYGTSAPRVMSTVVRTYSHRGSRASCG